MNRRHDEVRITGTLAQTAERMMGGSVQLAPDFTKHCPVPPSGRENSATA